MECVHLFKNYLKKMMEYIEIQLKMKLWKFYIFKEKKRIHTKYLKICKNSNELFKKIVSLLPEDTPIIFCISIAKNNINKWRNSVHESHALLFCKKQDSFHFFDPNYFWIKINNIDDLEKWFVKNYKPYNCYHIRKYENCLFDHD